MSKYKKCFQEMVETHQHLFTKFKTIHDKYVHDPEKWQKEFNEIGEQVSEVMRKYEQILCEHSEGGKFAKYSANLADKFKDEVRKEFSHIDFIGTIYT